MPRDAKLGLVVGVGLVLLIAVVFFRKDAATAPLPSSTAAAVTTPPATPTGFGTGPSRLTSGVSNPAPSVPPKTTPPDPPIEEPPPLTPKE